MKKFLLTFLFLILGITTYANNQITEKMQAVYYGNTYKTSRRTANGDKFDMNAMTCAAPKRFKFGTKLKVTNTANGKSIIVTVTDRGNFGNNKLDLTYGAFGKIANHRTGKINITVEIIE